MALGLVGRGVRALSDHVNLFYRVFKGVDPDNVYVRLPTGGSFEVRHSASNAPVLRVTDAGANGTVTIPPNSISSGQLVDGTIVDADVNASAGIAVSKLAHVGAGNVIRSNGTTNVAGQIVAGDIATGAVTSAKILDNEIVNADINAAAAIAVSKLDATPTANRVLRSNGTTASWGQVATNDMAANTINGDRIADATITSAKLTGASVPAGSITTTELADGTIMNVDVNAAAAIAVSKLAAGAAKTVLSGGAPNSFTGSPTLSGGLLVEGALAVGPGATGYLNGTVKAQDAFYPSNQTTLSFSAPVASVSLGSGTSTLVIPNSRTAIVLVINHSQGPAAMFSANGGFNTTALLAGSTSAFGTSPALDNKIHLIYNANNYYLYNGYGSAQFVSAMCIGT